MLRKIIIITMKYTGHSFTFTHKETQLENEIMLLHLILLKRLNVGEFLLKALKLCLVLMGNGRLSGNKVGSLDSCRVTWQLACIQPVCTSINPFLPHSGLNSYHLKALLYTLRWTVLQFWEGKCFTITLIFLNLVTHCLLHTAWVELRRYFTRHLIWIQAVWHLVLQEINWKCLI